MAIIKKDNPLSEHTYNKQIAFHYAAYRPALHSLILSEALSPQFAESKLNTGLDIGCGTGLSSIALAEYCNDVIGIDPSEDMLNQATKHPSVRYLLGSGSAISLPDNSVDVVSFAGVLSYTNDAKTMKELRRVCRSDAILIVYDFEVSIDDIMAIVLPSYYSRKSSYNHAENLECWEGIDTLTSRSKQVEFEASPKQSAHILLSDSARFAEFTKIFNSKNPYSKLVKKLEASNLENCLQAKIYFTLHRLR